MKFRLTSDSGTTIKYSFNLAEGQKVPLGRESSLLKLDHPSLQAEHCYLSIEDGELSVAVCAPGNEIFLNQERVHNDTVKVGDILQLGNYSIEFLEVPFVAVIEESGTRFIDLGAPAIAKPKKAEETKSGATKTIESQPAVDLNELADLRIVQANKIAEATIAEGKRIARAQAEEVEKLLTAKNAELILVEARIAKGRAAEAAMAEAKLHEANKLADKKIAEANSIAEAKIAEANTIAEAKIAEAGKIAGAKIAEANRMAEANIIAQAHIADAELLAKRKVAEAEKFAKEKIAEANQIFDNKLGEASKSAQEKIIEAFKVAENKMLEAGRLADARILEANKLVELKNNEIKKVEAKLAEARRVERLAALAPKPEPAPKSESAPKQEAKTIELKAEPGSMGSLALSPIDASSLLTPLKAAPLPAKIEPPAPKAVAVAVAVAAVAEDTDSDEPVFSANINSSIVDEDTTSDGIPRGVKIRPARIDPFSKLNSRAEGFLQKLPFGFDGSVKVSFFLIALSWGLMGKCLIGSELPKFNYFTVALIAGVGAFMGTLISAALPILNEFLGSESGFAQYLRFFAYSSILSIPLALVFKISPDLAMGAGVLLVLLLLYSFARIFEARFFRLLTASAMLPVLAFGINYLVSDKDLNGSLMQALEDTTLKAEGAYTYAFHITDLSKMDFNKAPALSMTPDPVPVKKEGLAAVVPPQPDLQPKPADSAETQWASRLVAAAESGNLDKVLTLLSDKSADPNKATTEGVTALIACSRAGHINIVKSLVSAGARINIADRQGTTPLMWAALKGHKDIVTYLVSKGADINTARLNGETALQIAKRWGHPEIYQFLADPNGDKVTSQAEAKSRAKAKARAEAKAEALAEAEAEAKAQALKTAKAKRKKEADAVARKLGEKARAAAKASTTAAPAASRKVASKKTIVKQARKLVKKAATPVPEGPAAPPLGRSPATSAVPSVEPEVDSGNTGGQGLFPLPTPAKEQEIRFFSPNF